MGYAASGPSLPSHTSCATASERGSTSEVEPFAVPEATALTGSTATEKEIKALLAKAGVEPDQEVVTYCAVGMRASLMGWAARSVAGLPTKIYIGSWQDWSRDSNNPIVE